MPQAPPRTAARSPRPLCSPPWAAAAGVLRVLHATPRHARRVRRGVNANAASWDARRPVSPAQVHCCDWAAGVDADKGPAACWLSKYTDDVVFQDYLGRMRARPAYLRAKQIQEASPPLA